MVQLRLSTTPALKARRGPTFREASFADFEQIAALATRHGLARPSSQEAWASSLACQSSLSRTRGKLDDRLGARE
jgi:hypothetical protein